MGDMTGYAKLGEVYSRPVYINGEKSGLVDPIKGEHYLSLALTGAVSSSEEKLLKKQLGECRLYIADKYFFDHNYQPALNWYESAAQVGNTEAIQAAGFCYYEGLGKKDYAKAFKYFEWGSRQPDAFVHIFESLAACYYYGRGTEKDLDAAERWYKKAAEKGSKDAKEMVKRLTPRTITVYCKLKGKWKVKRDVAIGCTLLIYRNGELIAGAASDFDGNFYVRDLQKGDILEFSYVGNKTKKVTITSNRIPEKFHFKLSSGDSQKIEYENL